MEKIEIRPAKKADLDALLAEPLPFRVRAFAAYRGDELIGVGGLAFVPDGTIGAFLMIADNAKCYAVSLHKAGLKLMNEARKLGIKRVVALAQDDIEPAERWLMRLGFKPMTVDGERVFAWHS